MNCECNLVRCGNLLALQIPEMINQRVRITVRLAEVSDISVVNHEEEMVNALTEVLVQDRKKTVLGLVGVVGNESVDVLNAAFTENREIELDAEVILIKMRYALHFISAAPITSTTQLIGAREDEIRESEALADAGCASDGSLLSHIVDGVVEIIGMKQIERVPILKKAILAVVLQAVSLGEVLGRPARIHLLLSGPPAVGKGMVGRAAEILSPLVERLSTTSVTPAGLVGFSERVSKNRTRVYPGKLALAHLGTARAEDLQHIDNHTHRHFYGILCDMMESGHLIRTTWRDVDIPVETALLADINPKSTTRPSHMGRDVLLLDDLGLPVNFLSRIDLVFCFDRDLARQIETMKQIVSAAAKIGPVDSLRTDPEVRNLQVLIAHLRDSCSTVQVDAVTTLVNEKLSEVLMQNEEKLKSLHLANDFLLRGAKSVLKLVAASARVNGRCDADEHDVALAFDLFEEKIRFLSMIEPSLQAVTDWKHSPDAKLLRQDRIREHFAGQTVEVATLTEMFREVTRKTILRDLSSVGARSVGAGKWVVPEATTQVRGS